MTTSSDNFHNTAQYSSEIRKYSHLGIYAFFFKQILNYFIYLSSIYIFSVVTYPRISVWSPDMNTVDVSFSGAPAFDGSRGREAFHFPLKIYIITNNTRIQRLI